MTDEREDRLDELREQEFLEEGWMPDPGDDPGDPERRRRLASLDSLLAEAVPEAWSPEMTDRVLERLDAASPPLRSPAAWLGALLATAASVLILVSTGALEGVPRAPGWLASLPSRSAGACRGIGLDATLGLTCLERPSLVYFAQHKLPSAAQYGNRRPIVILIRNSSGYLHFRFRVYLLLVSEGLRRCIAIVGWL